MLFKSKFYRLVCAAGLALSLSFAVFADTIRLKDGSIIKGKIVSFGGGKFTVVITDGARQRQMNFNAGEVESISFDADSTVRSSNETAASGDFGDRNNPIINAGQNNNPQTSSPKSNPTVAPIQTNPSVATPNTVSGNPTSTATLKPILINVKVLADNTSNGWTNSGFVLQKGQKIRISSSGRISLGSGRYTTSEGISSLPDKDKLMSTQPTGALIAVVGDDNNDFILVGNSREFTATRDGALFLGINEGNLNDNSGVFDVKVEIYPNN